jgi:DNA-binding FadR family transcriptional regulator
MQEGRLADRAYAGIIEIINTEDLEIGNRLPSEARLAEIFGISRTMVREALVRLASDGITEARRARAPSSSGGPRCGWVRICR